MSQTVKIAVPVTQMWVRAWMDHSRSWSIVEEALLLALALGKIGRTVTGMASASGLPYQVVIAALSRLMRFRLVQIAMLDGVPVFTASEIGSALALADQPLPQLPQERLQKFNIGFEHVTGSCFDAYQARLISRQALETERQGETSVHLLPATEGVGEAGSAENSSKVYRMIEKGGDRRFVRLATRETDFLTRWMVIPVQGSTIRHFPQDASDELRGMVLAAARANGRTAGPRAVATRRIAPPTEFNPVCCRFSPSDVVVGGDVQSALLNSIVEAAKTRLLVHSTFLDPNRFRAMADMFRAAVLRGVTVDLLWGASESSPSFEKTVENARLIAEAVAADAVMRGRVRMRMRTTGSHGKVLLADQEDGSWVAVLSSCNWMSTGFHRAELSVVLRHPNSVADVVDFVRRMTGRSPLIDDLADELRLEANDLRRLGNDLADDHGDATVTLLSGLAHDGKLRVASGNLENRFVIGSDRLGATAWSNTLIPGEFARERTKASVTVLYRRTSGDVKNRHAREMEREAAALGIRLIRTKHVQSHGKFLLWDDDDIVVTSLNWASTSGDDQNPTSELGVHIRSPGLAASVLDRLKRVLPDLPADI